MSLFDAQYPFDKGDGGSPANAANWGKMARLFASDGVVSGEGNELNPIFSGGVITVDTGAVWVEGFYGENFEAASITASANGLLTARLDYINGNISLVYQNGVGVVPTQVPGNVWDLPIAQINNSVLIDQRIMTSAANSAVLVQLATEWQSFLNNLNQLLTDMEEVQSLLPQSGVAYTAQWVTTGGGAVQPVLNTGTLSAFYVQNATLITVNFTLSLTSTSNSGTGNFLISLPFVPEPGQQWFGTGAATDASSNLYHLDVLATTQSGVGYAALYYPGGGPVLESGTNLGVQLMEQPVTGTDPFTASGNTVSYAGSITYEITH